MANAFSARCAFALASLLLLAGIGVAAEQAAVIPDAPRVWTLRDGRSASLRLVGAFADTVKFWNPENLKFHSVSIADLSDKDQQYLKGISQDGSRMWTTAEGKARRLRLTQFDGEKAIFEIPGVGYGEVQVEELCAADQKWLLEQQAFERSLNFSHSRAVATVLVALLQSPAEAVLPTAAAVQDELSRALARADIKAVLDQIGTDAAATVIGNGNAYEADIQFQRLIVPQETAEQRMAAFNAEQGPVVKDRVAQALNLTEAQASLMTLSFKLPPIQTPSPIQPGTTVATLEIDSWIGTATENGCCQPVCFTPCCVPECGLPRFALRCRCKPVCYTPCCVPKCDLPRFARRFRYWD